MTAEQGRARQALAFLAQTLRPDWDPPGVVAAIEAMHRDRQPLGVIAKATIAGALTPSTRTPGGIAARIRDGWTGDEHVQPPTPTAPKLDTLRCDRCGGIKPEGDDEHARICARRVTAEDAHRLADAARAEIRPTTTHETEGETDGDDS